MENFTFALNATIPVFELPQIVRTAQKAPWQENMKF